MTHTRWMHCAIDEAKRAADEEEVPIGCVVVRADTIIGRGHNRRETDQDPLAHAEIRAIHEAARTMNSWRLTDTTLYVTCEPCLMCAGAILQARVPRVVFGCLDPKAGAMGSLFDVSNDARLNHRVELVPGVLEEECRELLREFFARLRQTVGS